MGTFLIELINHFSISMKLINIVKYTAQITAPLHHHPHTGPQRRINHGKAIGKNRCQQTHSGKDERFDPQKPK